MIGRALPSPAPRGERFKRAVGVSLGRTRDLSSGQGVGKAREAQPRSAGAKKVLVVDDVQFNRVILGKFLTGLGYEVVFGCDGREAVSIFEEERGKHGEGGGLFCVLMDIQMPGMDGLEATKRIRSLEELAPSSATDSAMKSSFARGKLAGCKRSRSETSSSDEGSSSDAASVSSYAGRRVPIVAVSACSQAEQLTSPALAGVAVAETDRPWKAVGMDGFMPKPVTRDRLRQTLLELECSCASTDSSASEPTALAVPLPPTLRPQSSVTSVFSAVPFAQDPLTFPMVSSRPGAQQVATCSLGSFLRVSRTPLPKVQRDDASSSLS